MKVFLFSLFVTFSAMASNSHLCEYQLREKVVLSVFNGSSLVVQSNRLDNPAVFPITGRYETVDQLVYSGDLDSPWMPGTSFILRIKRNSPLGIYTVISPKGRAQSNIRITCKSF